MIDLVLNKIKKLQLQELSAIQSMKKHMYFHKMTLKTSMFQTKMLSDQNPNETLENECIADHHDSSQLNSTKLVDALFKHDPDIIILGSCFTNISVLNSILRASGIKKISKMIKLPNQILYISILTNGPLRRLIFLSLQKGPVKGKIVLKKNFNSMNHLA